jgi:rfaE bifunctional protein nucleotidyltransferase chain/domain
MRNVVGVSGGGSLQCAAMGTVLTLPEARHIRDEIRAAGKTLVFTNGHFDLLHSGHLDYLEKAHTLGDALFVGINGDAATEALKGQGRPLVPASDRARLVAALDCVDATVIFEALTANELIETLKPEIYVKGGDYHTRPLPERPVVEGYGGRVVLIDLLPERSTTALIAKIRALPLPNEDPGVRSR